MKKLIATITLLLLLSTTSQAQQYYDLTNGHLFSKDSPLHLIEVKGEVIRNESGEVTEYRVLNMWDKMTARKYEKLTNDEKGYFEYLDYKYNLKKKREEQKIQQEKTVLEEIKIKKTKDSLIVEKQKRVEDSLHIIKEKNINVWLDNSGRPEKVYKVNPKTLIQAQNEFENVRLLKVSDENVNFSTASDDDFIQIKSIKPTDVFVQLKYSSENDLVLLQNKVSGQLYIGKNQMVFYQPDMFNVKSSLFAETKEIKVLNAEDIAIQNRYKNILTTYKQKHARIKAICNKKAYEVRDNRGVARYNTKLFTVADKKEYNELDLWFENANSTLWGEIKEDELQHNGNTNVMEELLENDMWLNLKVGLEQSQSFEHIYN